MNNKSYDLKKLCEQLIEIDLVNLVDSCDSSANNMTIRAMETLKDTVDNNEISKQEYINAVRSIKIQANRFEMYCDCKVERDDD